MTEFLYSLSLEARMCAFIVLLISGCGAWLLVLERISKG